MIIFNLLLIKKISFGLNYKNSKLSNRKESVKRNITSILFITFLFIIMTGPTSIAFGFFETKMSNLILFALDDISFLNNSSLFWTCFFTNLKFKKAIINLFKKPDSKYRKPTTNIRTYSS